MTHRIREQARSHSEWHCLRNRRPNLAHTNAPSHATRPFMVHPTNAQPL